MKKIRYITLTTLALILSSCSEGNVEPTIYQWLTFLLPPITSIITWAATKYTRKSSTLQTMQESIDMLVQKNSELYEQVTELRAENAKLKASNNELKAEQIRLQKEIDKLKKQTL